MRGCRSMSMWHPSSAIASRRSRPAARRCSFRSRARPPTRWRRCATAPSAGQHVVSLLNVPESTIGRESERGVPDAVRPGDRRRLDQGADRAADRARAASSSRPGVARGTLDRGTGAGAGARAGRAAGAVSRRSAPRRRSRRSPSGCSKAKDVLYLGRGQMFPIAMEGALKLKEISLHPRRGLCRRAS